MIPLIQLKENTFNVAILTLARVLCHRLCVLAARCNLTVALIKALPLIRLQRLLLAHCLVSRWQ